MSSLPRTKAYKGPRTLVLDVSHHQGRIDWQEVASDPADVAAVIVRLGDGKDVDGRAVENLRGARAAGLLVGAYRYLRADHPLAIQIGADKRVLDAAGVELDLPLCPDLEGAPDVDGRGPRKATGAWQDVNPSPDPDTDEVLELTHAYCEASRELVGLTPWLYTGRAWLDHVRRPPAWASPVPLWLAIGAGGKIPRPWGVPDVVLHQYSAKGSVRGIATRVDLNHYHGTVEDLRAVRRGRTPAPAVDYVAAVLKLAAGAPEAERAILNRAARALGELRSC